VRKRVVRERENPRKYDPCRKTDTQQDRSRVMEWYCAERYGKSVWDGWSACVKNGCRQEKGDGSYFPSDVSLPDILDRQPSPPHVNSYAIRLRRYRRRDPKRHADYRTTPLRMTLDEFLRTQIRDNRTRRHGVLLMFKPTAINIHWGPPLLPYRMTYGSEDPTEVAEFGTATFPASASASASSRGPTDHQRLAMRFEGC
jgi:hypothetical protein